MGAGESLVGTITTEPDGGSILSRQQIVVSLGFATGALMGALLQDRTPLILKRLLVRVMRAAARAHSVDTFRPPSNRDFTLFLR